MSEAVAQTLALEVTLKGIEKVTSGVESVVHKMQSVEDKARSVQRGLAMITTAVLIFGAGIHEAMEQEQMDAQLHGFLRSGEELEKQLKIIDDIASKGVFTESQVYEAVRALDMMGVSVEDNIKLVTELGARMRDIGAAGDLIARLRQGDPKASMQVAKVIGRENLKAQGIEFDGRTINATTQQLLDAIGRITSQDSVLQRMQNTLGGTLGALVYQMKEIVESVGTPLLGPLTVVAGVFRGIAETVKAINQVTHGWVSNFAVGALLLVGLSKVLVFLKEILTIEKLISVWAAIRAGFQAGAALLQGLANVVKWLWSMVWVEKLLVIIETARAMLGAAIAWALGNKAAALGALAIIGAAVGTGIHLANQINAAKTTSNEPSSQTAADRPIRRDDIERLQSAMRGRKWTG